MLELRNNEIKLIVMRFGFGFWKDRSPIYLSVCCLRPSKLLGALLSLTHIRIMICPEVQRHVWI